MTTEAIKMNELTSAQRKELMAELAKQEKADKKKREQDIETLKTMQDGLCETNLPMLAGFGKQQSDIVESLFKQAAPLISIKSELYNVKETQESHTFTARDGSGSISVGYNMVIGFDGTSDIGIQKIQQYLSTLSKDDENRVKIEKILNVLMKRNKKGELNPTRIMDLASLASEIDDDLFTEGVNIVVASQFKTKTSSYVTGWMRNVDEKTGKETKIKFRITAE